MLYAIGDKVPTLPAAYWVAPSATVIGDVVLEDEVSVWWGAVLRAENDRMVIGAGSNVQDNAVLHVDPGFPLTLGPRVSIGHMAMLHGCTIGEGTLVGIGAKVLNGAVIGRDCLIGAGALIPEGKEIPDRSVVIGAPGRVVRSVDERDLARIHHPAESYRRRWPEYARGLRPLAG